MNLPRYVIAAILWLSLVNIGYASPDCNTGVSYSHVETLLNKGLNQEAKPYLQKVLKDCPENKAALTHLRNIATYEKDVKSESLYSDKLAAAYKKEKEEGAKNRSSFMRDFLKFVALIVTFVAIYLVVQKWLTHAKLKDEKKKYWHRATDIRTALEGHSVQIRSIGPSHRNWRYLDDVKAAIAYAGEIINIGLTDIDDLNVGHCEQFIREAEGLLDDLE